MTRAALYLRVSTEDQDEANQRRDLEQYCASRGLEVVKEYSEAQSGRDDDRAAFNRMLHDARVRRWDTLVFWAWDRLSRSGIDAVFAIMRRLEAAGVEWVSLKEPFLSSDADPRTRELLLAIMGWVAEQESRRISERTKAAYRRRKALAEGRGEELTWGKRGPDRKPRRTPRKKGTLRRRRRTKA